MPGKVLQPSILAGVSYQIQNGDFLKGNEQIQIEDMADNQSIIICKLII
jgi:hypothetical protein